MSMQRAGIALQRARGALHGDAPARRASGVASARWSNMVRSQSKANTPDDPPTAPLPECHEMEGQADFSNFLDMRPDTSLREAVTGLGLMLSMCYGLYYASTTRAEKSIPKFTLREHPTRAADNPITTRYTVATGAVLKVDKKEE
jgi:hypothetical protein